VLSHYTVTPASPTLSRARLRAALAFAEAIIPGSPKTPGADETTVARVEEVLGALSPQAASAWGSVLSLLDQSVRLQKGKPFHALSRAEQQSVLAAWEKSPVLRGPLHALAYVFKIAHFDSPRTYAKMGGELRVLSNVETARWERQIVSADAWTESRDVECDVVVVGTGAGGAVVGRELADRGYAVVFIEEGAYRKRNDFVGSFIHAHSSYFRNTWTLGSSPITLLMGKLVGGSTAVNTGTSLRPPPWVLEDWSERLDTDDFSPSGLEPYMARVERILEVSPPERRFIGPIADVVDRGCAAFGWSARPIPRNAVGCEGQGFCDYGCAAGARRSVEISYLPGALEKGAMIITNLRADRVTMENGRAVGVEAHDRAGNELRVRAKAVILAGGAVPTPMLLLRQGIANTSGQIGKNLSLHPSAGVAGVFDERLDPDKHIPQGYMVDEFLRDGMLIVGAQPDINIAHMAFPFTGHRLMRAMDSLPHVGMFGAMIRDDTRGRIWFDVKGNPAMTYSLLPEDVDRMHRAMVHTAEMCFAAGARRVYVGLIGHDALENRADLDRFRTDAVTTAELALISYHPLGTCRMGRDPKTSVVDLDHQTYDVPGLFIVDGSTVPGPPGVNPQIIIMAMATRAAERIAARL
jgi:glycine/D-amino acid oxidase-like deaminating enzyme